MGMDDYLKPKMMIPLVLGAGIRFLLAPLTEQRWDMYVWRLHQVFVYAYHANPFWPQPQFQNIPGVFYWAYPPFWLFTLLVVYPFYMVVSPTLYPSSPERLWETWQKPPFQQSPNMFESYWSFTPPRVNVNLPVLDLIIKTPIILADVFIAITLYKMIESSSKEKATYAYYAWLFNPYTIFISSVWGVFDAIPSLFTLLSLRELLNKKYTKSSLLLGIAILFKLYPIILIPTVASICHKLSRKFSETVKYGLVSFGLFSAVTFSSYFLSALLSGQEPVGLSVQLMTFLLVKRASPDWYGQNIITGLTPLLVLADLFREHNIQNLPVSPFFIAVALIYILMKIYGSEEPSEEKVLSYVVATFFAIYLTYAVVNPQYFLWVLPSLLLLSIKKSSVSLRYLYWIIGSIGILFVLWHYDLSYHVSPYFLPESVGYLRIFLTNVPITVWLTAAAIAIFYIIGIKLVFRKS